MYYCTKCDREPMNTKSSLKSHYGAAHGEPCHCAGCKKAFTSYRFLKRHLDTGCYVICGDNTDDPARKLGRICNVFGCQIRKLSWEHMLLHWKADHPFYNDPFYESEPTNIKVKRRRRVSSKNAKPTDDKSTSKRVNLDVKPVVSLPSSSKGTQYDTTESMPLQNPIEARVDCATAKRKRDEDELPQRFKKLVLTETPKEFHSVYCPYCTNWVIVKDVKTLVTKVD